MFSRNYYCLVAGLPDLILNENRNGLTSLQFRLELANQLNKPDYKLMELLFWQNDNKNLINLLLRKDFEFDHLGNYSEDYLKKQIVEPTDIVVYLKQFINDFKSENFNKSLLHSENYIQELFYNFVLNTGNNFIKQWFTFERNIKNIITAVNCRRYGYDTVKHLIPDQNPEGWYQVLFDKILMPEMFIDEDLPYLAQIFQITESAGEATEKEKATDAIKWAFLDEITVFHYFTIERILSFVIKLAIVERWQKLNDAAGKAFLERLIYELEESYPFDEEISLIH